MKVLHRCDQLPFGPHSDAVWAVGIDDLERQWRWKFEVLHCEADRRGALTDHADVRRCGEEFKEARASVLAVAEAQRQMIAVQLRRNSESDGCRRKGIERTLSAARGSYPSNDAP
jgi:hypothetical protein